MKNILIPFSGGLDSAELLFILANKATTKSVQPIYITFEWKNGDPVNPNKFPIEIVQAKKIIKELNHPKVKPLKIVNVTEMYIIKLGMHLNAQSKVWAAGLNKESKENAYDEVALGYCKEDADDWYGNELEERRARMNYQSGLKVSFPLINISKKDYTLPESIATLTWSCEGATIVDNKDSTSTAIPCGCCNPCALERDLNIFDNKKPVVINTSKFNVDTNELNRLSLTAQRSARNNYKRIGSVEELFAKVTVTN